METDFLIALLKDDDWLREAAVDAFAEHEDVRTSILSYAELLVLFYDREREGYEIEVPRAIANLLDAVPIVPQVHEQAVLTAATFLEEHQLTPFDALHAGLVAVGDRTVLSKETDYDTLGLDRLPLEKNTDEMGS